MGARLGQHLLRDEGARDAVAALVNARPGDRILEIGPGRGAITGRLLATGCAVTAIELDEILAGKLPGMVGPEAAKKLTIINEDFLRLDLRELGDGPFIVVGNLPYAVGTPILQRLLEWDRWSHAVLMFQLEVAERVVAKLGGADYGLLALSVIARANAQLAFEVPKEAFSPPPKVESGVVVLQRLETPRLPTNEEKRFWSLVKIAFAQRRKMASGVLAKAIGQPRITVDAAFTAAGVSVSARPEEIPFEAWRSLAKALCP